MSTVTENNGKRKLASPTRMAPSEFPRKNMRFHIGYQVGATNVWCYIETWLSSLPGIFLCYRCWGLGGVFPRGQLPWNQHPCGQESVGFAAAMVTYLSGATFQIHLMKGVIGHKFINKSSASTSTITQLRREPLQKHLCSTVPLLPWPKDWILLITHCWIERIAGLA